MVLKEEDRVFLFLIFFMTTLFRISCGHPVPLLVFVLAFHTLLTCCFPLILCPCSHHPNCFFCIYIFVYFSFDPISLSVHACYTLHRSQIFHFCTLYFILHYSIQDSCLAFICSSVYRSKENFYSSHVIIILILSVFHLYPRHVFRCLV